MMYEETTAPVAEQNTDETAPVTEENIAVTTPSVDAAACAAVPEGNEDTGSEFSCISPDAQEKRQKWSAFVEGPAVDFFTGYKLEKMTIDDGSGNKAKFSRTKDEGIKVEYTSSVLL